MIAATMAHMGIPQVSEEPSSWQIGHLTLTEKPSGRAQADCATCKTGMEVGETFGPIPGDIMLAEWVNQHTHQTKGKKP